MGWDGTWGHGEHPLMERFHERRLERLTGFLDLDAGQVEQWRVAIAAREEAREEAQEEAQEDKVKTQLLIYGLEV